MPRTLLLKQIRQIHGLTKQFAAWQLLWAIEALFPEQFQRLTRIGRECEDSGNEFDYTHDPNEPHPSLIAAVRPRVEQWSIENRISCESVNEVAALTALGIKGPEHFGPVARLGSDGELEMPPSISVEPYELRSSFLKRAGEYFDAVERFFEQQNAAVEPAFEDEYPFHVLAANRVGHCGWAKIGRADAAPLLGVIPHRSEKAAQSAGRRVAKLLGITMSPRRGRQKGDTGHPRPKRGFELELQRRAKRKKAPR